MVSVTIVTWNSAQYLNECFASLEAQDYRQFEVIIVDNASSDGTQALLRQVESRWQVIYNAFECRICRWSEPGHSIRGGRLDSLPQP